MLPTEVNKPSKEAKADGRGVKAEQSAPLHQSSEASTSNDYN